ncbi:recombinase RecT [Alistipes sp.]|uniref:recombinase RecT n=1 Tax=Alistipes sp. TaxID=1872444 RepID=UPI003AEF6705
MAQNNQNGTASAPAATQSKALAAMKDELANGVLRRIEELQAHGGLVIPKDYAVTNQMNLAWLRISEMTTEVDGKQRPVLEVVTKASVANSLLDMVLQGMDIQKKQGYFIPIKNKAAGQLELTFWRSYFGDEKLARGQGMTKCRSVVVYEGDEFEYMYTEEGETRITKHIPNLTRINKDKIVAAYAVVTMADGTRCVTLKTMQQIRQAWQQGATKGNSPAHRNFTDDMAARTVERAALKHLINSSSDAWLLSEEDKERRMITETAAAPAGANVEEAKFEEVEAPALAARSETHGETIPPAPTPAAQPEAAEEDPFKL